MIKFKFFDGNKDEDDDNNIQSEQLLLIKLLNYLLNISCVYNEKKYFCGMQTFISYFNEEPYVNVFLRLDPYYGLDGYRLSINQGNYVYYESWFDINKIPKLLNLNTVDIEGNIEQINKSKYLLVSLGLNYLGLIKFCHDIVIKFIWIIEFDLTFEMNISLNNCFNKKGKFINNAYTNIRKYYPVEKYFIIYRENIIVDPFLFFREEFASNKVASIKIFNHSVYYNVNKKDFYKKYFNVKYYKTGSYHDRFYLNKIKSKDNLYEDTIEELKKWFNMFNSRVCRFYPEEELQRL